MVFFIVIFNLKPTYRAIVSPFTSFIALISSKIMNIWGAGSYVVGKQLVANVGRIDIADGCNGIYATAVLISGVIAYPAKLKYKLWGIALGFTAIFIVNLIRVISLFYMSIYFPNIFEEAHVYIWQPIVMIWAIYVWYIWWKKIESIKAR